MFFYLKSSGSTASVAVRGYALAVCAFAFASSVLHAQAPAWWTQRGVLNTAPGAVADDYAVVNQGQVKHIAKQAYEEIKATLPDGAGAALDALWANPASSTDDYFAVNVGQLKTVAQPFYARLQQFDVTAVYPWTGVGADDYALANVGQLKNVFSFSFTKDTDGLGLLDWWQRYYFGHLGISASANPSGDGMSNLYKYRMGLNPLKNESSNDRDNDGVTNNQDARPNDITIGRLTVVITAPAMGSTVSGPIIDTTPISEIPPTRDSDGRGLSDVWQLTYTGHLGVDPSANPSGGGFSNLYKAKMGLNPLLNEAAGDADGDGIPNNQDARPNDNTAGRLSVVITVPVNGGGNL
jgi:hypothetical protein